jgi:hypothetical protein
VIEALRNHILPSRRADARRLARIAFAVDSSDAGPPQAGELGGTAVAERPDDGPESEGGRNGDGHGSHDDRPKDFRDVWQTSWDPYSDRRVALDALEHRRPKWVRALDIADGGQPSDWYIGPVGPTLPDVISATSEELQEFTTLAEMSVFDAGKDQLIRRRLMALAQGKQLSPEQMTREEEALRETAERSGRGDLPAGPVVE